MTNSVASEISLPVVRVRPSYLYDGLYTYYADCWDGSKLVAKSLGSDYYTGIPESVKEVERSITTDPEILAAVAAYEARVACEASIRKVLEADASEAQSVMKGKLVEVVRGTKVAKGTRGTVFWMEDGGYNKVGIRLSDKYEDVAWTYLKNIEVVDAEQYMHALPSEVRAEFETEVYAGKPLAAR